MKKLILVFLLVACAFSAYAADEEEYDNPGYKKSHGMIGAYMALPDYSVKEMRDNSIGGGGFIYYNVFNRIWGNVALGLSSEYVYTKYNQESFFSSNYGINVDLVPTAFNMAYMTSSDLVNVWAGVAFTYTHVSTKVTGGRIPVTPDTVLAFGKLGRQTGQVIGGDVFAGLEYLFTKSANFGIFFEFRYSITDAFYVEKHLAPNISIKETINFNRFRYTIGATYHF